MADPGYDDIAGGLAPNAPDLSSLQFPWSVPADAGGAALPLASMQPGLGIPTSAIPPPPVLGPPTEEQAAAAAAEPPAPPIAAPSSPPAQPYAQPPPPAAAPGPFGPPAPGVGELPDVSVSLEPRPSQAAELAADPLAMRPGAESATGTGQLAPTPALSDDDAARVIANLPPEQQAIVRGKFEAAKANDFATKLLDASTANRARAQEDADNYNKAFALAQQKQAELESDYKQLANAKIDPDRWWNSRTGFQKVAGYLAAIVGGLYQGKVGGPNVGLQMIQQHINEDVAAQQENLANRRGILGARQSAVGQMFAQTGDMYRSAETARAAAWETTIQGLQAEQQKYDPHGTTALRIADAITQARAQQAHAVNAYGQQVLKNTLDVTKENREGALAQSTILKNQADAAEAMAKAGKLGGAGAGPGNAAGTGYQVQTGFYNPFMHPDETGAAIMGKRPIGGKGEDAKERKGVQDQLDVYAGVNDYYGKLADIGRRIDNAKSLGESIWKARKTTLASEYDAAREALTVYLTKQLGDKLTQGQLEAQQHRIPERASVFEARDPGKQIQDALVDADRDFSRSLSIVGIDADPVIRTAQRQRAVVQASPQQQLDAAQAAAAAAPGNPDAQRELAAAEQSQRDEVAASQKRAADTQAARALPAPPGPLPLDESRPAPEVAAIRAANRATNTYAELHRKFMAELGTTDYRKGLKPGELAAAEQAQNRKIGELAGKALDAHDFAEEQRLKAQGEITKRTTVERAKRLGLDPEEAQARLRAGVPLGDEAPPAAPPPNPLAPNASYLPGADPFAPPISADSALFPPRSSASYTTKLTPQQEVEFRKWLSTSKAPFDPSPTADYDMRGFWLALHNGDPRATTAVNPADHELHFPDTWKTPYHKSFSNESIYAEPGAPGWQGDRLVDKNGRVIVDETPAKKKSR